MFRKSRGPETVIADDDSRARLFIVNLADEIFVRLPEKPFQAIFPFFRNIRLMESLLQDDDSLKPSS
jgi:hypothetical protein